MKVKDIMTSDIYSINQKESVQKAAQIMRESDIGSIPVNDGENIVGMITDRDIAIRNVALQHNPDMPVEEIMTANIINCSPETTVEEAADLMSKYQVRRLPVIENGRLIGIVSLGDFATEEETEEEAEYTLTQVSISNKE